MHGFDAVALVATRYRGTKESEVLTEEGWEPFEENAILPFYKIPNVQGRDLWEEKHVLSVLDSFETHIRSLLPG